MANAKATVVAAKDTFVEPHTMRRIKKGDLVQATDPLVTSKPHLFVAVAEK